MTTYRTKFGVTIHHADCLTAMAAMPADSVDAIVTDPPYGLGFMGKAWDDLPPGLDWAKACCRVLKPGGHILAFGGTRTWHRLAVAVEDAGFEIRDSIAWLSGSGFPKSLDVSKAIDKAAGATREVVSEGASGSGTVTISALGNGLNVNFAPRPVTAPATPGAEQWQGWGTALKPAFEPVVVGRKPLAVGTVAANVLAHGTGALNIDACRIESGADYHDLTVTQGGKAGGGFDIGSSDGTRHTQFAPSSGRWPANVVLDESQAAALDESRFFYVAKAPKKERPVVIDADGKSHSHPTVKPLSLMRWLVRIVTPPGGTILDPFAGSGTTVEAALLEGFRVIGIERETDYLPMIEQRIRRAKP